MTGGKMEGIFSLAMIASGKKIGKFCNKARISASNL